MAHEPKLTVYQLTIKPENTQVENSNRWLFRNIIGQANEESLEDGFIFIEVFRKFIAVLDTQEMYSDENSKKCITANQPNIEHDDVSPNIVPHSEDFIIEGIIEGGVYGRKRNKTSIVNKIDKARVNDKDAITDDYYFMVYLPPVSDKMILMIQSYEGDSIDSVYKDFWKRFFTVQDAFKPPKISRYIPPSIITRFKNDSAVSSFEYSTEIPSKTLFGKSVEINEQSFKVVIKITPSNDDLSIEQFERAVPELGNKSLTKIGKLLNFKRRKGTLRDKITNKQSPFELNSDFNIRPIILLSKFINFPNNEIDFSLIKNYCFGLLNEIKPEIYPDNAVQER